MAKARKGDLLRMLPMLDLPPREKDLIAFLFLHGRRTTWTAYSGTLDQSIAVHLGVDRSGVAKVRISLQRKKLVTLTTDDKGRPVMELGTTILGKLQEALDRLEVRKAFGVKGWPEMLALVGSERPIYTRFLRDLAKAKAQEAEQEDVRRPKTDAVIRAEIAREALEGMREIHGVMLEERAKRAVGQNEAASNVTQLKKPR